MIDRRTILLIMVIIANFLSLNGQNLTVELGSANFPTMTKSELPSDINDRRVVSSENYFKINYEQFIKKNLFISGSFSRYPMNTYFNFYRGNRGNGVGWVGSNVSRIDLSLMYNFLSNGKFFILTNIGLGLQISNPNGVRFGGKRDMIQSLIPDPDLRLLENMEGETFSNSQIVPVLGLKFGYAFWGRLELFMDIQQVFGHKTIQELRMSYTYKGVEQPEAISYSDGTGRFWALGIGYRFVKVKTK